MSAVRTTFALGVILAIAAAAHGQEKFSVNSPVRPLLFSAVAGGANPADLPAANGTEPFKSGEIAQSNAITLLGRLVPQCAKGAAKPAAAAPTPSTVPARPPAADECRRATIFHVLRWGQADHSTVAFQRWYVYDPNDPARSFDWTSRQARFQQAYIAGRQSFRLIYIHLNYDLAKSDESIGPDPSGTGNDVLKFPVEYKIAIQKQQTQLAKDFETALTVLGLGTAAAAADPVVGYFSVFDFDSAFKTSKIAITASLKQEKKPAAAAGAAAATTANDLSSQTFVNEHRAWLGLSAAIPLNSYDDVEYDRTNDVLQAKTVKRQNVYFLVDLYVPPVAPGFTKFRWLPHPIVGLPIKGQPLRHSMAGVALGLRWAEPFWAAVFNIQDVTDAAGQRTGTRLVTKGVWGVNISIDAVAAALKGGGSGGGTGTAGATAAATAPKKKGSS